MSPLAGRTYSPIGIDLGSRLTKAVQLVRGVGEWRVHALAALERPEHQAGPQHIRQLDDLLYRQGFRGRKVVVALPRATPRTAVLELPPRESGAPLEQLAHGEVARMHRLEAGTLSSACWDLPRPPRASAGTQVFAVGCTFGEVEGLVDLLEGQGFYVQAADASCWALARGCGAGLGAEGMAGVLDFGWSGIGLCVVREGVVVYERVLAELGVAALHRSLRESLQIAGPVADFLLFKSGLEREAAGGHNTALLCSARAVITAHVAKVSAEMQVALGYVGHRYSEESVRDIVAVGGGAAIPKLAEALSVELQRSVKPATLGEVSGPEARPPVPECLWPLAAGLARYPREGRAGGRRAVNLIPPQRVQAARRSARGRAWMAVAVAYALVMLACYLLSVALLRGGGGEAAKELQRYQRQANEARAAYDALMPQLNERQATLQSAQAVSTQPDWSHLLTALAQSLGDSAMLQEVDLQPVERKAAGGMPIADGSRAGGTSMGQPGRYVLRLRGLGVSQEVVARFVLGLEGLGAFESVRLLQTARQTYGGADAVSFNVECVLGGAAEGP